MRVFFIESDLVLQPLLLVRPRFYGRLSDGALASRSGGACERDDGCADTKGVEIVRPRLHHPLAFRQMLGKVVCRAHGVAFRMRKLALDRVAVPALFVESGGGHRRTAGRTW